MSRRSPLRSGRGAAVLIVGILLAGTAFGGALFVLNNVLPKPTAEEDPGATDSSTKAANAEPEKVEEPAPSDLAANQADPPKIELPDIAPLLEVEIPEQYAAVLAVADYKAFRSDAESLSKLIDANLLTGMDVMTEVYLAGLDHSRPLGAVILVHEEQIVPVGLIPVENQNGFFQGLSRYLGPGQDAPGGGKIVGPLFFLPQGKYVLVGQEAKLIRQVKDPESLLRKALGKSRLVMLGRPPRVPRALLDALETWADQMLDQKMEAAEDTGDIAKTLRQGNQFYELLQQLNEADRMYARVDFDTRGGLTLLSMTSALPGTDLAKLHAANVAKTNRFFGAVRKSDIFWMTQTEKGMAGALDDLSAFEEIAQDVADHFKEAQQDEWNALVDDIRKYLLKEAQNLVTETAISLLGGNDRAMLFAFHLSDPSVAVGLFRRGVPYMEKAGYVRQVQFESATRENMVVDSMEVLPPRRADDRQLFKQAFGTQPTLHVTHTDDAIWVLMGPDEPDELFAAIERVQQLPPQAIAAQQIEARLTNMLPVFPEMEAATTPAGREHLKRGDRFRIVRKYTDQGEIGYAQMEIGAILWLFEVFKQNWPGE